MAMREGRFSGQAYDKLAAGTVQSTISYVAQTFRERGRPNPTKDEDGELGRLLSREYKAYRKQDPNLVQQKALLVCVLQEVAKMRVTENQIAMPQLSIVAWLSGEHIFVV